MLVSVAAVVEFGVAWPAAGMPFFVDAGCRATRRLQPVFPGCWFLLLLAAGALHGGCSLGRRCAVSCSGRRVLHGDRSLLRRDVVFVVAGSEVAVITTGRNSATTGWYDSRPTRHSLARHAPRQPNMPAAATARRDTAWSDMRHDSPTCQPLQQPDTTAWHGRLRAKEQKSPHA